jgi:hypothetical protein
VLSTDHEVECDLSLQVFYHLSLFEKLKLAVTAEFLLRSEEPIVFPLRLGAKLVYSAATIFRIGFSFACDLAFAR